VSVAYTGLVCLAEIHESSGADASYVVPGTVMPFATSSYRSQTYSGVDSQTIVPV